MSKKISRGHDSLGDRDCPVERVILAIGGKWKMLVLRSLLLNGSQRYNELLRTVRGISPKELTRNLRQLERGGFLLHEAGDRRKAHYQLTELGSMLFPPFHAFVAVGEKLRLGMTRP
jgi:DNA-binding HxlR family transcriptional regulator